MKNVSLLFVFFLISIIMVFPLVGPSAAVTLSPPADEGTSFLEHLKATTPVLPREELRALWVIRHALASREEVDRVVDLAIRARFHLIFVQVRGRGDAFYRSTMEPPAMELERPIEDFDPLQYLLTRAGAAGIAVHAWVNVFYIWSDGSLTPHDNHVTQLHPEWLLTDERGYRMDRFGVDDWKKNGIEGYFLSPATREVREYTVAVIREIATRYDIDGIHLDYIRYPGPGYGYDENDRTRFALEFGVDPLELLQGRGSVTDVIGEEGAESIDELLVEWRCQQVDSMVKAVREAIGDLPLSAAVVADPRQARMRKGQDWTRWIHQRDVDFVALMAYSYKPPALRSLVQYLDNVVGKESFLVGLPLFGGRIRYLEASISMLREEGVLGFSLFSYRQLADHPFSLRFLGDIFWEEE